MRSLLRYLHFIQAPVLVGFMVGVTYGAQSLPTDASVLEVIVVEATRVETNLQETPISVHVLSSDMLEEANIDAGRDLGIMVPNVVITPATMGERQSSLTMRGLPGVTTYVDGVWTGNFGFLQRQFVELERVEILRGPQGTHFGRNSNGGAIQVITRRPGDELRVSTILEGGRFGSRTANISADLPVSQTLLTKWTLGYAENDGFMDSQSADLTLGSFKNTLLRGDIEWMPNDDFSVRLVLESSEQQSTDPRIVRISNSGNRNTLAHNILAGNPDFLAQARTIDPDFPDPPVDLGIDRFSAVTHEAGFSGGSLGRWQTRSNLNNQQAVSDGLSAYLELQWEAHANHRFISRTRYGDYDFSLIWDRDASEFAMYTGAGFDNPTVLSQEMHWIGNFLEGKLESLLGFYYQQFTNWARVYRWADWDFMQQDSPPGQTQVDFNAVGYVRSWGNLVGNPVMANYFPRTFLSADFLQRSNAQERAMFGELKFRPVESLEIAIGLRVTEDDSGRGYGFAPGDALRSSVPGQVTSGILNSPASVLGGAELQDLGSVSSPRVSVSWQPAANVYLYASYAEGFTQGQSLNVPGIPEPVVLDPEVVETWEAGIRSQFLNNRLRVNATLFQSEWEGLRVTRLQEVNGNVIPVPSSDGNARASGIEIDLSYLPNERWVFDLAAAYLDSRYTDIGVPAPNGTGLQPGISLPYAPELSYSLGAGYIHPLDDGGEISVLGNYGWMDDYERSARFDLQTRNPDGSPSPEPGYGILNARLVYQSGNRPWQVYLYGKNLTDEWYVNGGENPNAYIGYDVATIGRPREYGIGFRYNWTR